MIINDTIFNVDLNTIIVELQSQLHANGSHLIKDVRDVPDNIMITCPYHKDGQERKPSAGIKKSDGTFHCFTCGETHSLQEVISHCFGRDDDIVGSFGWTWLLKNFLTISVENRKELVLNVDRNNINNIEHNCISEVELDSYRYTHPYMYKRKLTDEIIELFDIGYDKNTRCITFPIRNISGNTLFVARRSVDTKFFNYPQGIEKPVYGLYELKLEQFNYENTGKYRYINDDGVVSRLSTLSMNGPKEIIICESMIDALTCWVYGKYAVALNGLGNDLQFKQLNNLPCRKFILATDMDEAGKKARQRIRKNIRDKIVTEYEWDINVAKDINDMTKEYFNSLVEFF